MKKDELLTRLSTQLRESARSASLAKYKPHDKQVEFHTAATHGRGFMGGNRSGKTVGGAVEAIWWLLGKHPYLETPPPPVRGRAVATDFMDGCDKVMIPEIRKWLPKSALIEGSWDKSFSKQTRTLTLSNGSFIEFMSSEQDTDKFAGTSRHFIWFDEEPPKEIFDECKMRLLDTKGCWWMTMTPVEGMTWVYDDVYLPAIEGDDPNIKIVMVDTRQNTYLDPEAIKLVMSGLDADAIKSRIEGSFVGAGGLVYKVFQESVHVIPPLQAETVKGAWAMIAGMDHGFTNPTAWLWAVINKDGDIVIFDEHYESGLVVSEHAKIVLDRERIWGRTPLYRVGDPSIKSTNPLDGTSIHMEYARMGVGIMLGTNDQEMGLNRGIAYFKGTNGKPKLHITSNCTNLIFEIKRLKWDHYASKKIAATKNRKEGQVKKNDHACDAMRYLLMSRPEYEAPVQQSQQDLLSLGVGTALNPYRARVARAVPDRKPVDALLGSEW